MRARRLAGVTETAVAMLAASVMGVPRQAHACGGCFSSQVTVVTAHRMAVAYNGERTILWDQFVYSGRAEDFVWVLPVQQTMTDVQLADPAFFDELEAATSPVVVGPPLPAPTFDDSGGDGFGLGCGSADETAYASGASPREAPPPVTVHSMQTVGPYETVTVSSESPTALVDWLQEHGYPVPEAIQPVITHYVDMGFAFVVLRLRPGEGVQAMQPVRVSYPGTAPLFPLRMISAGIADKVGLLLWVFAEGRYETDNFANGRIDPAELIFDRRTAPATSNYEQVFDSTIAGLDGRAWITESALDARTAGTEPVTVPDRNVYIAPTGRTAADWAVALEGIPGPAVLTRLRTNLAASALDQDLLLRAAPAGDDAVSRVYLTDRTTDSSGFPAGPALVLLALAGVGALGRRRRRSR